MTPKEKAIELYNIFNEFAIPRYTSINDVKHQCNIVADQFINSKVKIIFWESVKLEIIRL